MRLSALVIFALLGISNASWFASDSKPEYSTWSTTQLQSWLSEHNVAVPTSLSSAPSAADLQALVRAHWDSAASYASDQSGRAQAAFANYKADAFDAWDESRLREFLLEQGVVNPRGPREQLLLLAKQKWSQASASASSAASGASTAASTAVYGNRKHQASKSASSVAAQATETAARVLDNSKDYVYSTWDDNRLRAYLEARGVIDAKKAPRSQLLAKMHDTYARATEPLWQAWSDSYIHEWLVEHDIIKSGTQNKRDALLALMDKYYYGPQDTAYSAWNDSQTKAWLVEHGVIKSDAQLQREKLQKLIADNYSHAQDTLWSAWSESDMKEWLVEHGYIRSDAQKSHDELVKLMHDKYHDYNARTAPYLVWPDARLRAYLRQHDISEGALPTDRPGLLQETRIRYVQTSNRAEALFSRVRELVNGGVEVAEDQLGKVLELLSGGAESAKERTGATLKSTGEKMKGAGEYVDEKKVEL
ncbi:hypothetical protein B0H21DRAFT_770754 [Amylocystis lapponica]|nr:hypothetical protein B0H21DRAFT_770754 [Amylocystis lapponica]